MTAVPRPVGAAGVYTHTIFVGYAIKRLVEHGGYPEFVDILRKNN
jgi:hypothetical protein